MDTSRSGRQPLSLPSPSSSLPLTVQVAPSSPLPPARLHPLRPGSQKEVAFINYVDSKILQINRRYAKKFSCDGDEAEEDARGYDDFEDVVEDLDHVLDTVWVSSTRKPNSPCFLLTTTSPLCDSLVLKWADYPPATLQIPYLLSLAGIIADYLPAFPFAESATIRLVDKVDQAFAHLLSQETQSTASSAVGE